MTRRPAPRAAAFFAPRRARARAIGQAPSNEPTTLELRAQLEADLRALDADLRGRIPEDAYVKKTLPNGKKIDALNPEHPDVKRLQAEGRAEAVRLRDAYAGKSTRGARVRDALSRVPEAPANTGTPREVVTTDYDLTGSRDVIDAVKDELAVKFPKAPPEKTPFGWRIPGEDINLVYERPTDLNLQEYQTLLKDYLAPGSDMYAAEGGLHHVSKGAVGIYDPEGAVIAHAQKFFEAAGAGDLAAASPRPLAKPIIKAAKIGGTYNPDSPYFKKLQSLADHEHWFEVDGFGETAEAREARLKELVEEGKAEIAKARKGAADLTAEAEGVRDVRIKEYEAMPSRTAAQEEELSILRSEQVRSRISRNATVQDLFRQNPELVSELLGPGKVTRVVGADGRTRFKAADGREMTASELRDAILASGEASAAGGFRAAAKEFLVGMPPPGARLQFVKYGGGALLVYAVGAGFYQAFSESDPKDIYDPLYLKTVLKGGAYATGIPQTAQAGWESGTDVLADFYLSGGTDADLDAGGMRVLKIQGKSAALFLYRLGRGMTVDPVLEAWRARESAKAYEAYADYTDAVQKRMQACVDSYRELTLDKYQRLLDATLLRAERLRAEAEANGDARGMQLADDLVRRAKDAIAQVEKTKKARGNLDERVADYRKAGEDLDGSLQRILMLSAAAKAREKNLDRLLPPPPAAGSREDIAAWRDKCLKILADDETKDAYRERNKKACLAEGGKPRALTCKRCGFSGEHWWFGDRWSCPRCETCTMLQDLKRADGLTYRDYAQQRIALHQEKAKEVRAAAERMQKERLDRPKPGALPPR